MLFLSENKSSTQRLATFSFSAFIQNTKSKLELAMARSDSNLDDVR
jgi:hypothetical protein